MKIAVIMAVHGRIELASESLKKAKAVIKEVQKEEPLCFVAYSDDADFEALVKDGHSSETMLKADNSPLSGKNNAMLNLAMESKEEWTHLLLIGSDNFITKQYVKDLIKAAKEGSHVIGTSDLAVARPNREKACNYSYKFATGKMMGAGRLFSKDFLELTIGYPHIATRTYYSFRRDMPVLLPKGMDKAYPVRMESKTPEAYVLWPFAADSGLDNGCMTLVRTLTDKIHVLNYEVPQVLDVKIDQDNITPFDRLYDPAKEIDYSKTLKRFNVEL